MDYRFPNDSPRALVRMQKKHWEPLFAWIEDEFDVKLNVANGFAPAKQSEDTMRKLRAQIESMDKWELAGAFQRPYGPTFQTTNALCTSAAFERAVYASKSFVIALAVCRCRLTAHQAAEASHVEVRSQIEQWGEVEDSEYTSDVGALH